MIRCNLARMMGEHKTRIADVVRESGLSRVRVTLLYTHRTADKLNELLGCEIGELLERTHSSNAD